MGGWNEGSETYSKVTNNPTLRAKMVNSVYEFVTKWKFDGFDLDWEYPAQRGGAASDNACYYTNHFYRNNFISIFLFHRNHSFHS